MKHDNKLNPFWKEKDWLPSDYRNSENKQILVINDVQHALQLALKNKVVFLTNDDRVANLFNGFVKDNSFYGKDDVVELVNNWKDLNELKQILDKYNMFDLIVMNPPYDKNLHLKILENVIPHAEKVVNISPISILLNCVNTFKSNNIPYMDSVYMHLYKCHNKLPIDEVLELFTDARILTPLAVQEYSKTVDSIDEFERVNAHNGIKYIVKRCFDYANKVDNIEHHLEQNKKDGYRVKFGRIGGGTWTAFKPHVFDNFKEIVIDGKLSNSEPHWKMNNVNQYTKKTETMQESLLFRTKQEAQHFIDSYKTTFMQVIVGFLHVDMRIHPEYLPYMSDYTQPWTDKRFCEYFNITGYISDTEAEPGSEWEMILNVVTKK